MTTASFTGFPADTVPFLNELAAHNEREWFLANKERYDRVVLAPALAFITAIGPLLWEISPHIRAVPNRTRGSLMRVYRDTRFSKDKRPYKTNVGIQFRHESAKDVHAPGFYLHIEPQEVFIAAGSWHPARDALARIRQHIVDHPKRWQAARDDAAFRGAFEPTGDRLKRPPQGYAPDHPLVEDLKWKDFIAVQHADLGAISQPGFPGFCAAEFAKARGYMAFLCAALGVSF